MVKKNEEESPRTLKKEDLEILFQIEKRKSDRLPLLYYNLTTMCVLVLGQGGRNGA